MVTCSASTPTATARSTAAAPTTAGPPRRSSPPRRTSSPATSPIASLRTCAHLCPCMRIDAVHAKQSRYLHAMRQLDMYRYVLVGVEYGIVCSGLGTAHSEIASGRPETRRRSSAVVLNAVRYDEGPPPGPGPVHGPGVATSVEM